MHMGSCECRSVQYQLSGEPLTCYACHCTDCQTSSGSAFGLSMIVNDNDIDVVKGSTTSSVTDMGGVEVNKHYCPHCSTVLYFSADEYPGVIALKPGTFEDTSWFKPIAHLWLRSKQSWILLDSETHQYEKQPELSELVVLWAKKHAV